MSPGDLPFTSTVEFYADYRPAYPDSVFAHVADFFALDADDRVLDLGCGPGTVTLPLAEYAGHVVGMDPDETMLAAARARSDAGGPADTAGSPDTRGSVEWVVGSDADLRTDDRLVDRLRPLRLTTMGRSFHWMEQGPTLERLRDITEPGGGVALLNDTGWLTRGTADWQDAVYAVLDDYLDDPPERTGPVKYDDPWHELLADHGFVETGEDRFPVERDWTAEAVVGYLLSLSFCSPAILGDRQADFEHNVRQALAEFDRETFREIGDVRVTRGRVPRTDE
ncbi:class I SAM-dependent methyltransferase [Salinirubrum litoreum]|uniref:Methyltransferase domain-containing protein n=1 Tax=Salinirubrum litoreum TaxID=1126234 RepID=A0ABD5RFP4_9EURY|nr:class I SAM-dependent methyltransferase [Salinirubrum litoreum]